MISPQFLKIGRLTVIYGWLKGKRYVWYGINNVRVTDFRFRYRWDLIMRVNWRLEIHHVRCYQVLFDILFFLIRFFSTVFMICNKRSSHTFEIQGQWLGRSHGYSYKKASTIHPQTIRNKSSVLRIQTGEFTTKSDSQNIITFPEKNGFRLKW